MLRRSFLSVLAGSAIVSRLPMLAQGGITVTPLAEKLHLLAGIGGNIVILEGADGLLMIDSGLSEAAQALLAETGKIGKGKVTRLINTHWHYDHVGGNTTFGKTGARILANENVKARLSTRQMNKFLNRPTEPLPSEGLPVETFKDKGQLKHGGDIVHYQLLPPAHTDGDTVIHFQSANVIHGGDLLFHGLYPFIDYSSAGSLAGMVANAERIYKMADTKSKIVPGHGPLMNKQDVKEYGDMLADCLGIFTKSIREGKSLEELQAAKPFTKYDDTLGKMFLKPEQWIAMNYMGMKRSS